MSSGYLDCPRQLPSEVVVVAAGCVELQFVAVVVVVAGRLVVELPAVEPLAVEHFVELERVPEPEHSVAAE